MGERLRISGQKLAIFTWQGCTIEIEGSPDLIYESDETPMQQYNNANDILDAQRKAAKASGGQGPRVFVVGPTDSGKSTLCKILVNYAVRAGFTPLLADLDIGQGSITVPGCLAAAIVEAPVDLETGLPVDAPLVYYYGHQTPSENPALYKHLTERLAAVVNLRVAADAAVRASGVIINSMGWVEELGYDILKHTAQSMGATTVVVVGDERLYSQLRNDLAGTTVVRLPKSGGVVTRTKELRQAARKQRVEEYFYGPAKELSPASQTARFEELQIYRVGGGPKAPSSALPIGATSVADPLKVTKVTNYKDVLYNLVSVSYATK